MSLFLCLCVHFVACRNASSQRFRLPMMVRVWRPLTFLATTCTLQHAKTDWDLEKLPRVKGMVEAHTRAGPKDCQVRLWRWRRRWWLWRWWLWWWLRRRHHFSREMEHLTCTFRYISQPYEYTRTYLAGTLPQASHEKGYIASGQSRTHSVCPLLALLGQAHSWDRLTLGTCPWDRPTLGTCHWDEPTLGTGPLLGQAHSWDRPTLGTGPLLGQAHSWDRPTLGTGPPV